MVARALAVLAVLVALAAPAAAQGVVHVRTPGADPKLPVASLRVTATIRGETAETAVEQSFRNDSGQVLEGTYLFPIPEDAAVAEFTMWVDGKPVKGELLERGKARGIYDEIVRSRRDPGLLEWAGRDLFQASVFPIAPRALTRIRIAYTQILRRDAGLAGYRYPLRSGERGGPGIEDVSVSVEVASPAPIGALYSPSHAISIARPDERTARATWEGRNVRPEGDFFLYVGTAGTTPALSVATHRAADGTGTFLALVSPPASEGETPVPKDIVFVLDTSGSMAEGQKIAQAQRALRQCLGRLRPEDKFGLVTFATEARRFRDALVPADAANVAAADAAVAALSASGGTAIGEALESALGLLPRDDPRPAYVVFATDGAPTVGERDPDRLVALASARAPTRARLFVLGIGTDVNSVLCDRLAESLRGAREYVAATDELETKVSAFYDKVAYPVMTDLAFEVEGLETSDVYPKRLPDLFRGAQIAVLGRFRGDGARAVRLRGRVGDRSVALVGEGTFTGTSLGGDLLPRLWAVRKIGYLLEQIRLGGETAEVRAEVVRLAKEHGVATPYTSYLVVEDSERARVDASGARDRPARDSTWLGMATDEPPVEAPVIRDVPADHSETDNNEEYAQSRGEQNAVSDKPFQGKYWNDSIGVGGGAGGAFGGRFGGKRDLVARGGGGKGTEAAVAAALRWLKNHQDPDGLWSCDNFSKNCKKNVCEGRGRSADDSCGVSGLALIAFLGAGNTMRVGPYKEVVKQGLKYLVSVQSPDGCVGPKSGEGRYMYNHLACAMALAEAYGLSGMTPQLKAPAQKAVDFLLLAQNPWQGWGRGIRPGESDALTTAWAVLALKSAELSGLEVPPEGFQGAKNWFDGHAPGTPAEVAAALVARIFMGEGSDSPTLRALAARLAAEPPRWGERNNFETWHLGTLAAFQVGGETWRIWNTALKEALVKTQRRGGDEDGSWDPGAATGEAADGRVAATSLAALAIEIYYRCGNILCAHPDPASAADQALRSSGADGIEAGRAIDALKDGRVASSAEAETREVAGRTFRREGDSWVDASFCEGMPLTELTALSPDLAALLRDKPDLAGAFSLGKRVTVVVGDRAYRTKP